MRVRGGMVLKTVVGKDYPIRTSTTGGGAPHAPTATASGQVAFQELALQRQDPSPWFQTQCP